MAQEMSWAAEPEKTIISEGNTTFLVLLMSTCSCLMEERKIEIDRSFESLTV